MENKTSVIKYKILERVLEREGGERKEIKKKKKEEGETSVR